MRRVGAREAATYCTRFVVRLSMVASSTRSAARSWGKTLTRYPSCDACPGAGSPSEQPDHAEAAVASKLLLLEVRAVVKVANSSPNRQRNELGWGVKARVFARYS